MRALALFSVCALASVACQKTEGPKEATLTPLPANHPPTTGSTALPDPDLEGGNVGRAPRRLTVAQLKASIEVAVGRPWKGLATFAQSLGQADFAFVNAESTETNLVFAKFLEDGAREVCREAAQADLKIAKAAERVLARELPDNLPTNIALGDDAALGRNLIYLSTRFWGQPLEGEELSRWVGVWKAMTAAAARAKAPDQGLTGPCVALMTDPRFVTY